MTARPQLLGTALLATIAISACDAQEPPSFVGRPTWQMKGSLTSEKAIAPDTTTAIVWDSDISGIHVITETEVEGNFPAEFTLSTYEAPPKEALHSLGDFFGVDAKIGFGTLVAVDADKTPFYPKLFDPVYPGIDDEMPTGDNVVHATWESWQRGGVPDYLVVYLDGEKKSEHPCLADFEPGYSLFHLREYTEADSVGCENVEADALADFNREHGTSYTLEEVEESDKLWAEFDPLLTTAYCAADCGWLKVKTTKVSADERVTLVLDPEVEFVDWN